MFKYWAKNRLLFDILVPIILVLLLAFAFVFPMFESIGEANLMQSLYNNDKLDFDVPSPSYDQIAQLEAESSIESVFPYYYTEVDLSVNGKTRETNLFFSDAFDKLDQTMYCDERRIEVSKETYSNPIFVDYEFVKATGAKLGSTVSVSFGGTKIDFQIAAIYETNTYYECGAVLAKWEGLQKDTIMAISPKLVYSGAYIQATDHGQCKGYLENNYKPYGRLRDASEFATQDAYEIHYNAFMSANYSNEISDFNVKGQDIAPKVDAKMSTVGKNVVLASVIMAVALIAVNILLWFRKSERGYFARRKVSGDGNIVVYYLISAIVQAVILIGGILATFLIVPSNSDFYIPREAVFSKSITFIIVAALVSIVVTVENMVLAQKTKK